MAEDPGWYSPETTIWQEGSATAVRAALRRAAASGADYLVREVICTHPDKPPKLGGWYLEAELLDFAALADEEFRLLKVHGDLNVPEVKWHTPEYQGRVRLVARVAIIDQQGVKHKGYIDGQHPRYQECSHMIEAYSRCGAPGLRLGDIATYQCMEGHERINPGPNAIYMVDVDPKFYRMVDVDPKFYR